ncbi:MAG: glycosyltransferase family 2 protein [Rhizobacter sp.]|nr:glycosyltransferase family 2 protein [Rhizobacter sp.]
MKPVQTLVTVIIATTCEALRWPSMQRAIASVLTQADVSPQILVVVNGRRFDEEHYNELRHMTGLKVVYHEEGSAPLAQRIGRSLVCTPFFAFLDDDDEYLPGGLKARLAPLMADEALDGVASQGVRVVDGADQPFLISTVAVHRDALRALASYNWLASCGGLFRTRSVSLDYFDGCSRYLEWTLLAYKLASTRRLVFIDTPTFRIHDSPQSLSKSPLYRHGEIDMLQTVLQLDLPADVKASVRIRLGKAHHGLSDFYRLQHRMSLAWRHHLKSLRYPEGWRFISYTRKILPCRCG